MEKLYDRADIYDLLENDPTRYSITKKHWETILAGKSIKTLLDVSIGSGNLTLPLLDLGIALSGSDLSENMLQKCREKAAAKSGTIDLRVSDFRELTKAFSQQFDCVASTGNSLPYVTNSEISDVLAQMDALVRPGGYLYFDLRNWDRILRTRQRFYLYNPVFHGDTRVNLVQAWDYNSDGTMDFNLLFTFEKENRIIQKEIFQEHYHPVSQKLLLDKLSEMGYASPEVYCMPAQAGAFDGEKHDWYAVIARKPGGGAP
ncbi:MAG: class I SAM-dependent methyltransferase [Eubacteriales bacterium]|nr:class I SAM-dependent methyltransferase [Eubacteriales bacterium]